MTEIVNQLLNEHYYRFALIITICTGAMIISMGVDLFYGIRKAKQNGEATTSRGLKKTCDKAMKYFLPFIVVICLDAIICILSPIPIVSLVWTGYCVCCEFVSIREKAWEKAEIRKQERTMEVVLHNRNDLAAAIAEALKIVSQDREEDERGKTDIQPIAESQL